MGTMTLAASLATLTIVVLAHRRALSLRVNMTMFVSPRRCREPSADAP